MSEVGGFRKVLIIVHLPRASPRIAGLVRYLPEYSWQPIILTGATNKYRDLQATIIETPYQNAMGFLTHLFKIDAKEENVNEQIRERFGITSKKSPLDFFLNLGGEVINYPCPDKNWKPFALQAGNKLLQEENIDAIITSSPPVISHIVARELKEKYKTPWLADFRDLWSQNANYAYGPLRKLLDRRLELRTLSSADVMVTISEPMAEKLRALHKGKPAYAITHGFDQADINIPPASLTPKFTVTYTGTLYAKHDPSKLFSALRDLISDGTIDPNNVEVRFYGPEYGWLDKEIEGYGLSNIVKQHGLVPRQIAWEKQKESQLLLLLKWEDPRERGAYSGKIFEYLGAKRPILATGGPKGDVVDQLLDETKAGIHAPTVEDIKIALKELYQEYKLKGEVTYRGEESEINKYSHREMTRKFVDLLEQLTGK
jgi:hypothetical protein